jgi:hypothetical protein
MTGWFVLIMEGIGVIGSPSDMETGFLRDFKAWTNAGQEVSLGRGLSRRFYRSRLLRLIAKRRTRTNSCRTGPNRRCGR